LYLDRSPVRGIPSNYRNDPYRDPSVKFEECAAALRRLNKEECSVTCGARTLACRVHTCVNASGRITVSIDGITRTYEVQESGNHVFVRSSLGCTTLTRLPRLPRSSAAGHRQTANSPMPGQVLRILVREGQPVKTGDSLVVLEAMKMEQTVRTSIDGVVQSILVGIGQLVAPGQMLVQIGAEEKPE
jgi:biotin carboxyl carrier protein